MARRAGHAHAPGQAHKAAKQPREDRGDQGTVAAAATPTSLAFLGLTPAVSGGKHARPEHGRPAHAGSGHQPGRPSSRPVAVTGPGRCPAPVTPAVAPADPSGPGNGHGHAYGHDKA